MVSHFPFGCPIFVTPVSTIGDVFDTDILNTYFLPTAEINAQLMGKIDEYLPAVEGLKNMTHP